MSLEKAKQMEREGKLPLIPGKMVFTVKPVSEVKSENNQKSQPRWKRKARMVICGNRVDMDDDHTKNLLYAAGATAESLRIGLSLATLPLVPLTLRGHSCWLFGHPTSRYTV